MDNDVERGNVNVMVSEAVRSLVKCVGEKHNDTNECSPSIYKAPSTLRNLSPSSFKPRVVSIGPLHNKDENLKRFEGQKAAYVHDLVYRSESSTQTLTACAQTVASKLEKIKGCYADMKSYKYNDNELTEMMVMDACFILEFINKISTGSNLRLQDQYIPYDLVLLENQIPFFVLQGIYECINQFKEPSALPITNFILPLLNYFNLFQGEIEVSDGICSNTNHDHLLSYLHHCYQPREEVIESRFPSSTIHSAEELDRAGVKFKPNDDPITWRMAMKVEKNHSRIFWFLRKCTLTMPTLCIEDFTELVFRNLIAYEQSYRANPYVTSYARAMNMLIDTDEDIAKLVRSKVIVNHIGSYEEAANMINRICKEVVPKHFYYTKEWEQLDKHFKDYWPKKIVKLKRTYFHSPWSIIALFAGIVLFILALLQTIFTIKSS
ncbi:hypothetical protein HanPI659440_Chr14g0525841 [Helianthus annuus]|nr:hypothetical protein HanPI659440_Chr14g0525841 [Helianthus annuus]